jgi:hypothetical protein
MRYLLEMAEQVTLAGPQVAVVTQVRILSSVDQLVQPRLLLPVEEEATQTVEAVEEVTTISRPQERLRLVPQLVLHVLLVHPR